VSSRRVSGPTGKISPGTTIWNDATPAARCISSATPIEEADPGHAGVIGRSPEIVRFVLLFMIASVSFIVPVVSVAFTVIYLYDRTIGMNKKPTPEISFSRIG